MKVNLLLLSFESINYVKFKWLKVLIASVSKYCRILIIFLTKQVYLSLINVVNYLKWPIRFISFNFNYQYSILETSIW